MNALKSYEQFSNSAHTLQITAENERHAPAACEHAHKIEPKRLALIAELELRRREFRSRHLPHEFSGDVPWAMLLDLFVSEQHGRTRSAKDLCAASLNSPTVAMRWLLAIEHAGLLRRETGHADESHHLVFLTEKGRDSVSSILSSHL